MRRPRPGTVRPRSQGRFSPIPPSSSREALTRVDPSGWFVLFLTLGAIVLLVSEKVPMDVVGLGVMVAIGISGIGDPGEALAGFSNKAVVTIGLLFVLSEGLVRTGAVNWIGQCLMRFAGDSENRLLLASMILVAALSGFINNTPVVVLFVPIVLELSRVHGVSPSRLLMPISFASILGGTCVLIGTSTNLAINAWVEKEGQANGLEPFGMFEFTSFGLIFCTIGMVYLYFIGSRLLPDRRPATVLIGGGRFKEYLTEVRVPMGSRLIGSHVDEVLSGKPNLRLLQRIRGEEILWPPFTGQALEGGDILLVKGEVSEVLELRDRADLETSPGKENPDIEARAKEISLAELVMKPHSRYLGRTIDQIHFKQLTDCIVIALQRHGTHLREKISQIDLAVGDMLLIQGEPEAIARLHGSPEFLLLEEVSERRINRRRAPIAALVFFAIIVLASTRILDIAYLSMIGACLLLASRTITSRQAYRSIHWPILVLIAGMISLAMAMRETGLDRFLAGGVVDLLSPYGPRSVMIGVFLLTSALSQVVNKTAVGVLMVSIAVRIAIEIGVSPMPFAMAVVFGASACFASPFGYQTNAFVYGPGGYRFLDYVKVGLPLNFLLLITGAIGIPIFWPF